jgi:hypothetical protein
VLILAIIAVIVIAIFALKPKKEGNHNADQQNGNKQVKIERTDIEATKIPPKIPTDIPFESGATISQNYAATTSDGKTQGTRVFETKKSITDAYKVYETYFKQNNWTVVSTVDQPQLKSISAQKDGVLVHVSVNENNVTKVKTVDVTVTDAPPASN